ARNVGQQNPTRASSQRFRQSDELLTPPQNGAEVADDGGRNLLRQRSAIAAQAREVELMQQRRIEQGCLVALQSANDVSWRGRGVECLEFLGNRVEPIQGAAIVVFVVALD